MIFPSAFSSLSGLKLAGSVRNPVLGPGGKLCQRDIVCPGAIPHAQGNLPGLGLVLTHHQHVGHFHQLGRADFGIHALGADIRAGTDTLVAQLADDALRVFVLWVGDRDDAHLLGRKPDREVAGVVLEQETDKALVGAERGAVDAERRLLDPVLIRKDFRSKRPGWAKSTWLVASENSLPIALQTCPSILGP